MDEREPVAADRVDDGTRPDTAADRPRLDPGALPLPSISRRRLYQAAGLVFAGWLVLAFGRQVAEASAATDRAAAMRAQNAGLGDQVASLQRDLARVQDGRFVQLEARAHGLGGPGEIPFTLEAGAPTPGPDAPGSAAVRLGATAHGSSPLDGWLDALFGPSR
jgi:hypothetical protein